ncbi:MAG: type II toxin-antitoxin system YafQ family toxin [Patescibacteria group bacterium]
MSQYAIVLTKTYRKSFKKISRSGRRVDIKKLEEVISTLASGRSLPEKYKNHTLSGDLAEYEECHIKDDMLLVYMRHDKELALVLVDVGSHRDIFK